MVGESNETAFNLVYCSCTDDCGSDYNIFPFNQRDSSLYCSKSAVLPLHLLLLPVLGKITESTSLTVSLSEAVAGLLTSCSFIDRSRTN
jgi:hypothetical protein